MSGTEHVRGGRTDGFDQRRRAGGQIEEAGLVQIPNVASLVLGCVVLVPAKHEDLVGWQECGMNGQDLRIGADDLPGHGSPRFCRSARKSEARPPRWSAATIPASRSASAPPP